MNRHGGILCPVLCALLAAGCAGGQRRITRAAACVDDAKQRRDNPAISACAGGLRGADLSAESLRGYPDGAVDSLFRLLRSASFYSPDDESLALKVRTVFEEKARRGRAGPEDAAKTISGLVAARLFSEASSLKGRFPDAEAVDIPAVIGAGKTAGQWQVFDISADGGRADALTLPLGTGPKVVIVVLPGCGSVVSAIAGVKRSPGLAETLRANTVVITRSFDPAAVRADKALFAPIPVYVARKSGDFPGFDLTFSPRFYFLLDGKVLYDFKGWSDDNGEVSLGKIRKGLKLIGLGGKDPA